MQNQVSHHVFENSNEIIIELQFGEGGEDSKLFCQDLFDAYKKYAVNSNLKIETLNAENGHIIAKIKGNGAGRYFKNETGKHVIQRVPPTETKGRKQTSVVSVAVLPLPPENIFKPLPMSELEIIAQCGKQGAGGQNVNKVASAIRAKHIPTGFSVFINGRDQGANKRDAIRILTARVNDYNINKENSSYGELRKERLGNGSRGDKIRTYNILESRVVDHRFNKKINNVEAILKKGQFELLMDN